MEQFLSGHDIRKINLSGQDLRGASLSNRDMRGANMSGSQPDWCGPERRKIGQGELGEGPPVRMAPRLGTNGRRPARDIWVGHPRIHNKTAALAGLSIEGGDRVLAAGVYVIVFRVVHIMAGIAWAGSVFLFAVFIQPSVAAIAPAGAPFMGELLGKRKLVDRLIALGATTVIGGLFLYWHDWHAFGSWGTWIGSRFGVTMTIGAVLAMVALGIGILATRPNVMRLLSLGRQAAEAGGPPPPEMAAEIGRTQSRLKILGRTTLGLIALAALAMSIARYL
jgi:uncharacterized membrane protein